LILLRDSKAIVLNFNENIVLGFVFESPDSTLNFDKTVVRSEFERVRHEVEDNLLDSLGVRHNVAVT
jgi:hypothetical protein